MKWKESGASASFPRIPSVSARIWCGAFTYLPKLCSHIHFPMQSGSDRILKMMRDTVQE